MSGSQPGRYCPLWQRGSSPCEGPVTVVERVVSFPKPVVTGEIGKPLGQTWTILELVAEPACAALAANCRFTVFASPDIAQAVPEHFALLGSVPVEAASKSPDNDRHHRGVSFSSRRIPRVLSRASPLNSSCQSGGGTGFRYTFACRDKCCSAIARALRFNDASGPPYRPRLLSPRLPRSADNGRARGIAPPP